MEKNNSACLSVKNINEKRAQIGALAEMMLELPQVDCPVKHRFAPGCYLREIFMPKDSYVIGKIHATEHFNILLKGKVTVITAEGMKTLEAPSTFISAGGVQKLVYMHTDCIWQTVHVTESTDIEEIEKEVIVESYDQLEIDGLINKAKGLFK